MAELSKAEFLAKYGDVQVSFNEYYKFTFYFTGVTSEGYKLVVGYGGNSEQIYRYELSSTQTGTVKSIEPYSGFVYDARHLEIDSFYDYQKKLSIFIFIKCLTCFEEIGIIDLYLIGEIEMNTVNNESAATYVVTSTVDEDAVIAQAMSILESRLRTKTTAFTSPEKSKQFLRCKLQQLEHEVFSVLFLDNQNYLIEYKEMFRGTIDSASVYPREVAKTALELNAAAVIFAHNHPSGISVPSNSDRTITTKLRSALELFDIRVLDHIIIGDTTYSFAESGLI